MKLWVLCAAAVMCFLSGVTASCSNNPCTGTDYRSYSSCLSNRCPSTVIQPQFVQPPPIIQPQFVQPPPVIQPQFVQPPPIIQPQFVQPPPVIQPQFVQPPPVIQPQIIQPNPIWPVHQLGCYYQHNQCPSHCLGGCISLPRQQSCSSTRHWPFLRCESPYFGGIGSYGGYGGYGGLGSYGGYGGYVGGQILYPQTA
ncbi:uncharacterized protein LOC111865410 [Cryptotermes secundus]|uniref:uncharacterized protein LOC111865410 n=1 Tax=Cryptotermes secundus TaxID=105785 RepID=UPI000CD7D6AD|nr:uncharacterized protein LOC111865410 [Cryptotermes secundus]